MLDIRNKILFWVVVEIKYMAEASSVDSSNHIQRNLIVLTR